MNILIGSYFALLFTLTIISNNQQIVVALLQQEHSPKTFDPYKKDKEHLFSTKDKVEQIFGDVNHAKTAVNKVLAKNNKKKAVEETFLKNVCNDEKFLGSVQELKDYLQKQKKSSEHGFLISTLIFTGSLISYYKLVDGGSVGSWCGLISAGGMLCNGYEWYKKWQALKSLNNVEHIQEEIVCLKTWEKELEQCSNN